MTAALLRWTGLAKLLSFYRYFAFNAPRTTTAAGVVLLLGVAAVRLYLLVAVDAAPTYLTAYFALLVAAAVAASAGMLTATRPLVTTIGWGFGSVVAAASLGMYIAGRTVGLPGLPQLVGRWDDPLGTFAMVLAAAYLGLHVTVLTGVNIAVPQRRDWHD